MVKYLYERGKKLSKPKTQKQSEENIIKSVRKPFKPKNENEEIKDRILRDTRTFLKEEDDCYKPVRVGNFWNKHYIEHERNGEINKKLSVKEYLHNIKPYLRDIINDQQVQLTLYLRKMLKKRV